MSNHISADILAKIEQSERDGGVWLKDLNQGDVVTVETRNTLYTIVKVEDGFTILGHATYCPVPTKAQINGSTWGGSMLKQGFIGVNMHLEFCLPGRPGYITTSRIRHVEVDFAPNGERKVSVH